jgi:hypothetical protein
MPMSNEKNKTPATASAALPVAKAKITDFTEIWEGSSPEDLGMIEGNRDKVDIKDLVGKKITVFGYSERKGDTGPFMICTFTRDGKTPEVFVTGAAVVVRKLQQVKAGNGFPVETTVSSGASTAVKGAVYYDLR